MFTSCIQYFSIHENIKVLVFAMLKMFILDNIKMLGLKI